MSAQLLDSAATSNCGAGGGGRGIVVLVEQTETSEAARGRWTVAAGTYAISTRWLVGQFTRGRACRRAVVCVCMYSTWAGRLLPSRRIAMVEPWNDNGHETSPYPFHCRCPRTADQADKVFRVPTPPYSVVSRPVAEGWEKAPQPPHARTECSGANHSPTARLCGLQCTLGCMRC
jgi:hypothetical protein